MQGLQAQIPYFKELGLTYLHLMPLFMAPEGDSDGGYAVSDYREVNPALGTMDDLPRLDAGAPRQGLALCLISFSTTHPTNIAGTRCAGR